VSHFEFRDSKLKLRVSVLATLVLEALLVAAPASLRALADAPVVQEGEFFIISSVNVSKQQLVLKLPTEVTELVRVTHKTVCLDEDGKVIQFQDLRAGDTVYVTLAHSSDGPRDALRIRRGPMTLEELHRRYLRNRE